jgi:hypothetical protein
LSPDEDNYYEEEGVDFFNFLYLNYKSKDIPEKVFIIFQDELTLLAKNDLNILNYWTIKDINTCKNKLTAFNKNQLNLMFKLLENPRNNNIFFNVDFFIVFCKRRNSKTTDDHRPH